MPTGARDVYRTEYVEHCARWSAFSGAIGDAAENGSQESVVPLRDLALGDENYDAFCRALTREPPADMCSQC